MLRQSIDQTLEEMVRVILNDHPGHVRLGNVWIEWDGAQLSWDVPLKDWDVEAVWESLMTQATDHPEIEEIAILARAMTYHSI